jgi:hypothetical protein
MAKRGRPRKDDARYDRKLRLGVERARNHFINTNLCKVDDYQRALELRQGGMTYKQIAEAMGLNTMTAHTYVRQALEVMLRVPAEEVQAFELSRLDRLMSVWWERAVTPGVYRNEDLPGDPDAMDRVLKVLDRRYHLLGFGWANRPRHGEDGGQAVLAMMKQVLLETHHGGQPVQETTLAVAAWHPGGMQSPEHAAGEAFQPQPLAAHEWVPPGFEGEEERGG